MARLAAVLGAGERVVVQGRISGGDHVDSLDSVGEASFSRAEIIGWVKAGHVPSEG